jgi:predicted transcriptional regulator
VNIGTVRYHLFILGINHRIAVQKTGQKFVRYFPNSGTYSKDEQMIMSLLRREALRRVIETLMARPGLSNCELSHQLGLPESAMSKYMKELSSKGIIIKERASGGRLAYAIKDEYREKVAIAIKRIGD